MSRGEGYRHRESYFAATPEALLSFSVLLWISKIRCLQHLASTDHRMMRSSFDPFRS